MEAHLESREYNWLQKGCAMAIYKSSRNSPAATVTLPAIIGSKCPYPRYEDPDASERVLRVKSGPLSRAQLFAPVHELEAELAHDMYNERQTDDFWWEERRPLYVKLYRRVYQLEMELQAAYQATAGDEPSPSEHQSPHRRTTARTHIITPPARAADQDGVEAEAWANATKAAHLRWSDTDWREMTHEHCTTADCLQTHKGWPWPDLIAALARAEWATNQKLLQPDIHTHSIPFSLHVRFDVGDRVLCCMGTNDDDSSPEDDDDDNEMWCSGTVVWRLFRRCECDSHTGCKGCDRSIAPYQILLDEGALITAPIDDDCCIRLAPATQCAPSAAQQEELKDIMVRRLMRAWWAMSGGYEESDIGGLTDVHVKPGTIGRGLVDVECEEGLKEHHRVGGRLLSYTCVKRLEDRLHALTAEVDKRKAEAGARARAAIERRRVEQAEAEEALDTDSMSSVAEDVMDKRQYVKRVAQLKNKAKKKAKAKMQKAKTKGK
ncbi:hypothetical protein CYMTET_22163 [Cymbomonas tetramitiformis]|uniref:Uncharacterized protein n=1 Tax=Cymbomonas tetramitiformis TaxID=36881 RepID=A0AAE0G0H4_9CHLO|nr:hypothetical protein CYMTET_22163 [Cymbomonas tetramitiformis]